jgi:electron transfer flavoprotein alpha subunit
MAALVIAEHYNKELFHTTLPTLKAALQLSMEVSILVVGYQCAPVAEQAASLAGIKSVICVDHLFYNHFLAENMAQVVAKVGEPYTHLLAPATTFGKNLMPRVAGLLGIGQLSDITQIIDEKTFVRPIYAGNALATVESLDHQKIMTVRTTSFASVEQNSQKVPIENVECTFENKLALFIDRQLTKSDRPELTAAKIIISGGRGLQNAENFKLLERIANQLGAAIGASRAAVDAGFAPNDYQVGQTGKVVAPDLYIAIGISGAIQHVAGMKDSKVVVAINKDPEAPIFGIADYGLVGDLVKILPEFQQALSKLGYSDRSC